MENMQNVPEFMQTPITLFGIAIVILAICGFINVVATTISWFIKIGHSVKQPEKDKDNAIDLRFIQIETRINNITNVIDTITSKYDELVGHYHKTALNHDKTIASLIEGQKLLLEVEVASIDYKLKDGADKSKLREMDEKLTAYLTNAAYRSTVDTDDELDVKLKDYKWEA